MTWGTDLKSYVWIFPVGRGNAAFVRSALNQGFILDMGGGDLIDVAAMIEAVTPKLEKYKKKPVAQVVLSHPHADHISQCGKLVDNDKLDTNLLTCPHDKEETPEERLNWDRLDDNEITRTYRGLYERRSLPLQTILFESSRSVPNLEYGVYYVRPPVCEELHESDDNKYGNATSIVFYYRHGVHTVLFPGDITPEAMRHILNEDEGAEKRYTLFSTSAVEEHPTWHEETGDQPSLWSLLNDRGLTALVAPHHGLESCFSEDLYAAMKGGKPALAVLSERRKAHEGDGQTDARYQCEDGASGLMVNAAGDYKLRRSVSTKDGKHILIVFSGTGAPKVYMDSGIEILKLLDP